jgi:nanoRNase/pAp phosphatase (c-di-AMP/oligoRNAs hydrolase)
LYKHFSHEDKVLIVITADPDSISSAAAFKRLLWRKVAQVKVASTNEVRRQDNLKLIKALGLKLPLLSGVDLKEFNKFAMVDSQPHHNPQMEGIPYSAVIDHHPPGPHILEDKSLFADIRPDWGATASIFVNYLQAARIKPNKTLATALFYAIKTDTQNFTRQGQIEDMRAFRWLFPFIHHSLLTDIEMSPMDRPSFEVFKRALSETVFHKSFAFVFLEDPDHPDTLVMVADFLMRINGVTRVVISGVFDNKLIVVLRSGGLRGDLGKLASLAFGPYGSAGGHKNMARAEMELKALDPKIANKSQRLANFVLGRLSEILAKSGPHAQARATGAKWNAKEAQKETRPRKEARVVKRGGRGASKEPEPSRKEARIVKRHKKS